MLPTIEWNNLRSLLSIKESRINLSNATGISINRINNWVDPNKKSAPKGDSLVILAKYFGCTTDYLLDLTDIRFRIWTLNLKIYKIEENYHYYSLYSITSRLPFLYSLPRFDSIVASKTSHLHSEIGLFRTSHQIVWYSKQ